MKKIFLLAMLPLFLAGCNAGGEGGEDDGGDSASGDPLPYSKEEANNKLADLGKAGGFEFTYITRDDEEKTEETLLGMKGEYTWSEAGDSHVMYRFTEEELIFYDWNSETNKFKVSSSLPKEAGAEDMYDAFVSTLTFPFYFAQESFASDEYCHKVKDLTYIGRRATEYSYDAVVTGVVAIHYRAIIDKELGITLYYDLSGKAYDGSSGSAGFEMKSFKSGSDVSVPAIEE